MSLIRWQPAYEQGSGGFVVAVSVSPWDSRRVLTSGDMLGIALSTDGDSAWKATYGLRSWEMAAFTWHPAERSTGWVGSMSGPWRSADGGENWADSGTTVTADLPPRLGDAIRFFAGGLGACKDVQVSVGGMSAPVTRTTIQPGQCEIEARIDAGLAERESAGERESGRCQFYAIRRASGGSVAFGRLWRYCE